jgi:hypothetical protein
VVPSIAVGLLGLSLCMYLIPAWLSRQRVWREVKDVSAATVPTAPSLFQNAAIAYAIQLATFGPFFVWGASGAYLPGIVNSIFFGIGLSLFYIFRRRVFDFLSAQLEIDQSFTLHGLIASRHGNSRLVALTSACLTIFALCGVILGEMIGASAILRPFLGNLGDNTFIVVLIMFLCMFLYCTVGGNEGVLQTDQLQLGIAYCSLFLCITVMIASFWLFDTESRILSTAILSTLSVVVLIAITRKFQFIERSANIFHSSGQSDEIFAFVVKCYNKIEQFINIVLIASTVAIVSILIFAVVSEPFQFDIRALGNRGPVPWIGIISLAILPLAFNVCDTSNWQRMAAFRPDLRSPSEDKGVNRALLNYSVESALVWLLMLFMGAMGAIFVGGGWTDQDDLSSFLTKVLKLHTYAGNIFVVLFLTGGFAIALSTMSAVFSAVLAVLRLDVLRRPIEAAIQDPVQENVSFINRSNKIGFLIFSFFFLFYVGVEKFVPFGKETYVNLLLGFYGTQVAFFPSLVASLFSVRGEPLSKNVRQGGAVASIILGAIGAIVITLSGMFLPVPDWVVWTAFPGALIISSVIYAGAFCVSSASKSSK